MATQHAIDLLMNTDMGDIEPPAWMVRVKEDYFKKSPQFTSRELGELLDEMDEHGVERGVLLTNFVTPSKRAVELRGSPSRSVRPRRRWTQPLASDAEPARARELREGPPRRVHHRRPELLGRRDVPAQRRRLLPALHEGV